MKKLLSIVVAVIALSGGVAHASEVKGTINTGTSNGVGGTVIASPIANPGAGTYTDTQNVTLSATGASSIHFTTNGDTPSCSSEGGVFSSPIVVSVNTTIKAVACYPQETSSPVVSFVYVINRPSTDDGVSHGSNAGGGNGPSGVNVGSGPGASAPASTGQVLGATTSCGLTFKGYMGVGKKNDPDQVKKLQAFLNTELGLKIPVTGYFGPLTKKAVEAFQLKYSKEILAPWLAFGLPNEMTPTGYVYKTTQRWINKIMCSTLDLPIPQLP